MNGTSWGVLTGHKVTQGYTVICICKPLLPEQPQPGQLAAKGGRAHVETISGEE